MSPRPVALVTGANRGLGLEVSRLLAEGGHRVWLAARRPEDAAQGFAVLGERGLEVAPLSLDVTDTRSIDAAVARVAAAGETVDVVVNNAGVMMEGTGEQVARTTLATNVLGPREVVDRFLPQLSQGARVVMVSSGMGALAGMPARLQARLDPPPSRAALDAMVNEYVEAVRAGHHEDAGWAGSVYSGSKALLNALTRILAAELQPRGVKVNAVCPGWVQTRMGGQHAPRAVAEGAAGIAWAATLPPDGPTGGFFRDGESIPW